MNKKVLTLCAGFLLAGSAFTSINAETLEDAAKKDGGYFLVYVNNQKEIATDFSGSGLLSAESPFYVEATEENKDNLAYLWKVETVTSNGAVLGYKLVNAKTGAALSVKEGDTTYDTFLNNGVALWFKYDNASQVYKGFIGKADKTDASAELSKENTVWRYNLVEVKDEVVSDEDLNELYNSTGFNLKLNDDKYKDVANIFDDQRIKAIKVGRGTNAADPVKSPVKSEIGYGFPAGTYFVVSTPKGAYPTDEGEQYKYLQQCTFIVVNPVENDINSKADREAGKGFQLTTVLGSDMNKYLGADTQKQPKGRQISVSNACFEVSENVNKDYAIVVKNFWFNKAKAADIKDTDAQETKANYNITVTEKVGEDNDDMYLTTNDGSKSFIFEMEEVFTQKALDWLNTNGMAAYNIQFVNTEDEVAEDMYLYCPAYGNEAYAKGAKFVDLGTPETQFVITDVNTDDNSLTFTNRANNKQSLTVKLYEEADGVYSIAVAEADQANDNFTVISVDNNGNLNEGETLDIHGMWAKITPATVDKFAGAWDVDNLTEVTMLFARDDEPTSNKLYVHTNDVMNGIAVSNTLAGALQFQLIKDEKPTYRTNIYAYKSGDQVLYKSQGDTVAYYTYQFQAYKDGVPQPNKYLALETGSTDKYGLSATGDNFIIKDNAADNSVQIIKINPTTKEGYERNDFVAVEGWDTGKKDIKEFEGATIKKETIDSEAIKATDIRTYLNIESPDVTLDPKSTYVTMTSDLGLCITMQEDSRDAIAASNDPMTIRLFATDTDRQVPSFLVATGYDNASQERMFLFNPADSVNYYVAEGAYDKEYQWDEGINKLIFKQAYLNEAEAAHDTLFTTIKGKEVAVSNVADNNKNVQGGLDKFKFQIVLADDEEDLYWIRQNGAYVHSINGKLTLSEGTTTNAIKVKVEATDMPTANEGINAADEAVKVVATNGAVVVKGAEGKNVVVSTILGKVVANEVLNSDNETIAAPAGIVVVSVDGESFKVAVK